MMMDGGIRIPRVPPAAMVPAASSSDYLYFFMLG